MSHLLPIDLLVEARSRALHRGEHLYAQRLSNQIVDQLCRQPQHCPHFDAEMFISDPPNEAGVVETTTQFVFDRVNEHGDVVYKRVATEDEFLTAQRNVPNGFRYTYSGLKQKGMTVIDRLRIEHISEVNAAAGARFGHPDEQIGVALTGVSRGVMLYGSWIGYVPTPSADKP